MSDLNQACRNCGYREHPYHDFMPLGPFNGYRCPVGVTIFEPRTEADWKFLNDARQKGATWAR